MVSGSERQRNVQRQGQSRRQRDFSTAVSWWLLLTGMAVLGACIVVPAWMNCEIMAGQSRALSEQVEEYQVRALADWEAIEAAQTSVAFNERLVIEELNHQRPGEQVLLASYVGEGEAQARPPEQGGVGGPAWLGAFAEPDTRNILLVMSGGLVLFTFVYYPAGGRSGQKKDVPKIPVHYSAGARYIGAAQTPQSSFYKISNHYKS